MSGNYIRVLASAEATAALPALAALLRDAVDSGASIGYTATPDEESAAAYWRSVISDDSRVLIAAIDDGVIAGAVQLVLEQRENGSHRAELAKLFVLRSHRRRGFARQLMRHAIDEARRRGRALLVMDTIKGGNAERLCEKLGFTRTGEIPRYARSTGGRLEATVLFHHWLEGVVD